MSTGGRRALVRAAESLLAWQQPWTSFCLNVILQTLHPQLYPAKSSCTLAIVAVNPRQSPEEAKQCTSPTVKKGVPAHSFREHIRPTMKKVCQPTPLKSRCLNPHMLHAAFSKAETLGQ